MAVRKAKKIEKQSDIQELINLKEDDITYSYITELFGDFNGKVRFNPYDEVIIPPGSYGPEGKKLNKTIYTTVGIWIFNKYFIEQDLYDLFGYINETIDDDKFSELNTKLSYALCEDKITIEQLEKYVLKGQKFQPFSTILCPGFTEKMLFCTEEINKKKKELVKKYEKEIAEGDVVIVSKIEQELLDFAKEYLKDDPGLDLFNSGARGSFGNNFKNLFVMKGAIANSDPKSPNEYDIALSNYMSGMDKKEYNLFSSSLSAGPYYRAKKTEVGGYYEKLFRNAFQHIVLLPEGTDCKTEGYVEVIPTKKTIGLYMYMYVIEGGKLTEITSDNMNKFVDKTIKLRFPTECKAKKGICNKCMGNLFYRVNIKNAGISLTKIPSTLKNIMMKNFHDSQVTLVEINPEEMFNLKN